MKFLSFSYTEITPGKMSVVPRAGTRVVLLYLVHCSRCSIHSAPLTTSVLQFCQTTWGGKQQFSCKFRADATPNRSSFVVRPQKWEDSQVGFQGSNASGRRIVLLPGAFWAHGASKMVILGASLLLYVLQHLGAQEGMLPPGACRTSRASARRIVSCRGLCASSLCPKIPLVPAPTFGVFRLCTSQS